MGRDYIAHISADGRREELKTHLTEVAEMARRFAEAFDAGVGAYRMGLCHDAGKYTELFQKRIRGENVSTDHSTAGAKILFEQRDLPGAMAVAGHHGGLPDLGSRVDSPESLTLIGRTKRRLEDYSAFFQEITLPATTMPEQWCKADPFSQGFFSRMLFSCLVDADFLCTEQFMAEHPMERGMGNPLDQLMTRFETYAEKTWNKSDTPLNAERLKIRKHCQAMAASPAGLFHLTVPTGGGKTAASMTFALHHARRYGKERIIYVIPYTSIIEQNSEVFEKALGKENILQHHSNVDFPSSEKETPEDIKRRLATENWDAPIIMTTAVQFLESLFAAKPSKCRKLHNIANSVIIFDEAQMLPFNLLRPSIAAIAELIKRCKVSAVMCTATQPSLGDLFHEFLPQVHAVELCPPDIDKTVFHRVNYNYLPNANADDLIARLQEQQQVLCVVNTRAKAEQWYSRLTGEGNFHLSSRMTSNHRKRILSEVKSRLAIGEAVRVISTSLIEAGVDVDFPIVYREAAGMDSIIQAAGRCNREGKLAEPGMVTVFNLGEAPPRLQERNISTAASLLANGIAPDDEGAIAQYFEKLMKIAGKESMDNVKGLPILRSLQEGESGCKLPLRTIAERFKVISEDTATVYVPTKENHELITQLREGFCSRSLMRRLGLDAVNVYRSQFCLLDAAGCVEKISPDAAILLNPEKNYSQETGIVLKAVGGDALFG